MANKTKVKRTGSGRTVGSFSFVLVKLGQLNAKFNDPEMQFKLSRLQAQELGLTGLHSAPAATITKVIEGTSPAAKSHVTAQDLNAETE